MTNDQNITETVDKIMKWAFEDNEFRLMILNDRWRNERMKERKIMFMKPTIIIV